MFNLTLLKYFLKQNWMIWLGFLGFLLLEMCACIFLMDYLDAMMGAIESVPGFSITGGGVLSYSAGLFASYGIMFSMIYYIFVTYRILYRPVDNTSMSAHLATGIKRRVYLNTGALFLLLSIIAMFFVLWLVCGLCMLYWGAINWAKWLNVVASICFLCLAMAFVCFFFASVFAGQSMGKLGTIGLPLLFLVIYMIADMLTGTAGNILSAITPFGWLEFKTADPADGYKLWFMWDALYTFIAVTFFGLAQIFYERKQLSI